MVLFIYKYFFICIFKECPSLFLACQESADVVLGEVADGAAGPVSFN